MPTMSEATAAGWKDPKIRAKRMAGIKKNFDKEMKRRLEELAKEKEQ